MRILEQIWCPNKVLLSCPRNKRCQLNVSRVVRKGVFVTYAESKNPGPSCSKLTTSLVNDSLKFTSSDTQIC